MGDGLSAVAGGGQAAVSLRPDIDGTGSLLDWILSTLEKTIQWCLGSTVPATAITAFTLASRNLGLDIHCAAVSTVLYSKAHVHAYDSTHQTRELTYVIGHVTARLYLWKLTMWKFLCRGLTVFNFKFFLGLIAYSWFLKISFPIVCLYPPSLLFHYFKTMTP